MMPNRLHVWTLWCYPARRHGHTLSDEIIADLFHLLHLLRAQRLGNQLHHTPVGLPYCQVPKQPNHREMGLDWTEKTCT